MGTYDVHFLKEAYNDLEEIALYITQGSKTAALQMYDEIINKANDLSTFPKRGRLVPDEKMRKAGYRTLLIKQYIVFYRIIDRDIFIYRVIHGTTDYPMLYEKIGKKSVFDFFV